MRQLGPYQLIRKIGSGGMAEVWSACWFDERGATNYVAIKLLAAHLGEREEYREMFLSEARLSMMLSHRNIVRVLDVINEDSECYMVMELIEGMTLSQLERGLAKQGEQIPLPVSAFVVKELLTALSYAHTVRTEAGSIIVHRDVSPQNVMVTTAGEVKLMDFGIARFANQETQGAFVKGKLQYMPPEQLRRQTRKPTVDIYAVGAILHELLDGRRFRGKIPQAELLQMVVEGEVPPLRDPSAVPGRLEDLRRDLLAPDENHRVQSAKAALRMLTRWSDFRDTPDELRELVQRFVAPDSVYASPEGSKVSSVPEGSFSGIPEASGSGSMPADDSGLHLGPAANSVTEPTGSEVTSAEVVAAESSPRPVEAQRARRSPTGLVVAALGLVGALGLGGLWFAMRGGDDPEPNPRAEVRDPSDARADARPTPGPDEDELGVARTPEPPLAPPLIEESATETGGLELETEGLVEGEDAGETSAGEELDSEQAQLIPVEFVANEFFFVYVRVSGHKLTLEPRDQVKLEPGRHAVYLRQSPDERWTRAGRITIEPGNSYRVEMRKPKGLRLVTK